MQKHARVSKIAHIFQARNERRVRETSGESEEKKGERTEYFLFGSDEHQVLSLKALSEEQQRRGTDNRSGADAHYDDWQIQLTAGRAPPRRGRPGLTSAKYY